VEDVATARKLSTDIWRLEFHKADWAFEPLVKIVYHSTEM
jgi:hypothetical protein